MPNNEKLIEKLKKQVAQYEAKGYKNTAAHQILANLQKSADGVPVRNTKKVQQEKIEHGE